VPETVTACIIAQDEEERLPAALESLCFCDRIILVDGGSHDSTVEIARRYGATVVQNPWPGFAIQRNLAIDMAATEWILELDADEVLTEPLQDEVRTFLAAPPPGFDMAALPRREIFFGGKLGASGRYPLYRYRLFRRAAYRHDETRTVHEGFWPNGPVWPFTGDISHINADSWREALTDMWTYARLEAEQVGAPRSPRWYWYIVGIALRPPAKALYRLLVLGGWRDGWRGVAKVALDCASDAIVWGRVAVRGTRPPEAPPLHFGQRLPQRGPVRLAAIASGAHNTDHAAAWLHEAGAAGADTVLVADSAEREVGGTRVRSVARLGALLLVRALDSEFQLRPVDALVPFGSRARALVRVLPSAVRGPHPPVAPVLPAAEAVRRVRHATRRASELDTRP
jgi:hypothetical protein